MAVDTSALTPQQLREYTGARASYFKGTIAVAVTYGVIAISLFLITVFSPEGKTIITETLFPFTVTFIGGMIVVIALLLIAIFSVKPPPVYKLEYDNYKCPDYWQIQETPKGVLSSISSSEDKARMKYRCVKFIPSNNTEDELLKQNTIQRIPVNSNDEAWKKLLDSTKNAYQTNYVAPTSTQPGTGQLRCNIVYPELMNYYDTTYDQNDSMSPNKLRCKYAEKCGIPWTSACPASN